MCLPKYEYTRGKTNREWYRPGQQCSKMPRTIGCKACASGACGRQRVTEGPRTPFDAEPDVDTLWSPWMKPRLEAWQRAAEGGVGDRPRSWSGWRCVFCGWRQVLSKAAR